MSGIEVRPARADDEPAWRQLWDGYCAFYEASVPEDVTTTTWERLLDPDEPMEALVAEQSGVVVGFVNCVLHRTTWGRGMTCYLEDLFVSPDARGAGAGRALMDAVIERSQELGWDKVYWHTRRDNARARSLYDSVAKADDFVRYVVPPD